ncbi:hypothetical protein [Lacunisphaera limnophila]|nr:hypothetical protein [Lacunisphaera limnophila]
MISTAPIPTPWCSFRQIESAPVAAMVAERCLFSLDTLAYARFHPGATFALTEHEDDAIWRWAIVGAEGNVVNEGRESTQAAAQYAAETFARLTSP